MGYDTVIGLPVHYARPSTSVPGSQGVIVVSTEHTEPALGGTWDLTFDTNGQARAFNDIPYDIDNAGMQALVNAEFGPGACTVEGDDLDGGFTLTFPVGNGLLPLADVNLDIEALTGGNLAVESAEASPPGAESIDGPAGTLALYTSGGTPEGSLDRVYIKVTPDRWILIFSD